MHSKIPTGMRLFLYGILAMIKNNVTLPCNYISDLIPKGIARSLYHNYCAYFDNVNFDPDCIEEIDDYYKSIYGIFDGKESLYDCEVNDGLYLLIKLTLNSIY